MTAGDLCKGECAMIIESAELTAQQKAAIEEILGRPLLDRESISVSTISVPTTAERQVAREKLINFLNDPGRPRPAVSEEELDEAITEAMRTVRPSYRPMR
jgi:hypothetical protein